MPTIVDALKEKLKVSNGQTISEVIENAEIGGGGGSGVCRSGVVIS